jgi:hypothetical protein
LAADIQYEIFNSNKYVAYGCQVCSNRISANRLFYIILKIKNVEINHQTVSKKTHCKSRYLRLLFCTNFSSAVYLQNGMNQWEQTGVQVQQTSCF